MRKWMSRIASGAITKPWLHINSYLNHVSRSTLQYLALTRPTKSIVAMPQSPPSIPRSSPAFEIFKRNVGCRTGPEARQTTWAPKASRSFFSCIGHSFAYRALRGKQSSGEQNAPRHSSFYSVVFWFTCQRFNFHQWPEMATRFAMEG